MLCFICRKAAQSNAATVSDSASGTSSAYGYDYIDRISLYKEQREGVELALEYSYYVGSGKQNAPSVILTKSEHQYIKNTETMICLITRQVYINDFFEVKLCITYVITVTHQKIHT